MNKIKMGKYLKELRTKNKMSQQDLSEKFAENYFEVSINAISSWEKGKSIPEIDKLNFLAELYGVTVDDILDGEQYHHVDLNQIYHMHQDEYFVMAEYGSKRPDWGSAYEEITKEGTIIRKKFKNHVLTYIEGDISRADMDELLFFLKNDYVLKDQLNIVEYLAFLKTLSGKNISSEEKWWEAQRYIKPISFMQLTFNNVADETYKLAVNQERMNYIEPWEKDMLLSMIQNIDPVYYDPTKYSSKNMDSYEKKHGRPFDREQIIKETITYLVNNGAVLNKNFFGYKKEIRSEERIIDIVENIYTRYINPLIVSTSSEDHNEKTYIVENTLKNRLLINREFELVRPLKELGYSIDQIIKLLQENKEIPDEVYLRAAEKNGIDVKRDMSHIKGDLYSDLNISALKFYWSQIREYEIPNYVSYDKVNNLINELKKGNKYLTNTSYAWVGGTNWQEREEYVYQIVPTLSFKEFNSGRMHKETKQMMNEIDKLSVKEIREKYFNIGGAKND